MEPYDAIHFRSKALIVSGDQGGAALPAHQIQEFGEHLRRYARRGCQ